MGVVKWLGCVAATIVVLSVIAGIVMSIGFLAATVAAIVLIGVVIYTIAALLKLLWEEVFS